MNYAQEIEQIEKEREEKSYEIEDAFEIANKTYLKLLTLVKKMQEKINYLQLGVESLSNIPFIDGRTWIPCSERLPDHDGYYLTSHDWRIQYPQITEFILKDYSCDGRSSFKVGVASPVIAWMPLPEPFKGDL